VLTIAHRIATILDSTKIMVMDQGRCIEFDTPANLLARPDSAFRCVAGGDTQCGSISGVRQYCRCYLKRRLAEKRAGRPS
jgi:ABC-type proline/glycine betaine transport system ATPase subunit